jgi:hypothetical protein
VTTGPELPLERERGRCITRTIHVENQIDAIIADYFAIPTPLAEEFEGHVLRRLDFSEKISTLIAIMYESGAEACTQLSLPHRRDYRRDLEEMRELRNLCAHAHVSKQRAEDGGQIIEFVTFSSTGRPRRVRADAKRFAQIEERAAEMVIELVAFRSLLRGREARGTWTPVTDLGLGEQV